MNRRRSTPWIHRYSRPIIGAIALVGATLTAYLTFVKLSGGTVACSASNAAAATSSCNSVLSSPYATIFGLPLSLFGCLAYLSMATFALVPLGVSRKKNKQLRSNLEKWTWLLLFAGAASMTVFSGYLMYLLAFKINAVCLYCIGSALFSLSLLVLTLIGHSWEDIGQLLFTGILVGMVTLIGTLGAYASVNSPISAGDRSPIPQPTSSPTTGIGWEVTTTSGESEIALANHLKQSGVKAYMAWWCPHCYNQKQLFGKEAAALLPRIECAPEGENPQTELCVKAGIKAFPSWEINGKIESGVKNLDELAEATGYQGSRNFKYQLP